MEQQAPHKRACWYDWTLETASLSLSYHRGSLSNEAHLIVLPVLKRIHCGMGLFCLAFFARIFLVLKVF